MDHAQFRCIYLFWWHLYLFSFCCCQQFQDSDVNWNHNDTLFNILLKCMRNTTNLYMYTILHCSQEYPDYNKSVHVYYFTLLSRVSGLQQICTCILFYIALKSIRIFFTSILHCSQEQNDKSLLLQVPFNSLWSKELQVASGSANSTWEHLHQLMQEEQVLDSDYCQT
jgi:hypothetical protein